YDLRQWTIPTNQSQDPSVIIFHVTTGMQFDDRIFRVPYETLPGTPQ
ncbi:outer membrane lipoprotein carrier protein LolA, partial [Rhizobium leguminosarum]